MTEVSLARAEPRNLAEQAAPARQMSRERSWRRRLRRDRVAMAALIVLLGLALTALSAPLLSLQDPLDTAPANKGAPIGSEGHLLGTDQVGRE